MRAARLSLVFESCDLWFGLYIGKKAMSAAIARWLLGRAERRRIRQLRRDARFS